MYTIKNIFKRLNRIIKYSYSIAIRMEWLPTILQLPNKAIILKGRRKNKHIYVPIKYVSKIYHLLPLLDRGALLTWINGDVIISLKNDITIHTSASDTSSGTTILEAFYDEEYEFGDFELSGKSVLDIGANIGDVSISFCLKGAREVVSLEPVATVFNYLEKNVEINNVNVTAHKLGLSRETRRETWKIKPYATASASGKNQKNLRTTRIYEEIEVQLMTARDFQAYVNYKKFDVIKVDCEGYEYEIITKDFIECFQPSVLFIEYHDGPQHLPDLLRSCNFTIAISEKNEKLGILHAQRNC